MNVLIIEDDPADAELAREFVLGSSGDEVCRLDIAENLREALELLESESYSVLLTDLNLPDATGDDAFLEIARVDSRLPVVILSGNDDEKAAAALVAKGAQDYINKSDLNARIMRRTILHAIERKTLEEDLREKNRALAAAQEELIFAAKMESTGHLAAGIAHEVKNPLAVIQLGVDTLFSINAKQRDPDPLFEKCLQRIQSALTRADGIIHELLDFSSDRNFNWEVSDIHGPIEQAIGLLSPRLAKSKVKTVLEYGDNLPELKLDRHKIEQAVINLVLNAEQAMKDSEVKSVRLRTESDGDESGVPRFVAIHIEDSGDGIPPDDLVKVFDAFYTTKDPDQGTGLGLTVVQRIIQLHEGTISLGPSEEMGGLHVEIRLPAEGEFRGGEVSL